MVRTALATLVMLLCAASGGAFVFSPAAINPRAATPATVQQTTQAAYRMAQTSTRMALATPPPAANMPTLSPEIDSRSLSIKAIASHDDYLAALSENQDKLVVLKFYDQFCRACDEIRPRFEELSRNADPSDVAFFQVEFTTSKDLCKQLGIRRLPTVQIYTEEGRVADLPAGPSRFSQVEEKLVEVMATRT
ncbi:unnamed protein product [Sphacelaria rigidula]